MFYGSNGYLVIDNYNKYYSFLGKDQKPGPAATERDDHFANFIDAVRSRKRQDLNAEIEEGAMSCSADAPGQHLVSVGRTLHFDAKTMTCMNDPEANKLLTRAYRAPFDHSKIRLSGEDLDRRSVRRGPDRGHSETAAKKSPKAWLALVMPPKWRELEKAAASFRNGVTKAQWESSVNRPEIVSESWNHAAHRSPRLSRIRRTRRPAKKYFLY